MSKQGWQKGAKQKNQPAARKVLGSWAALKQTDLEITP